MLKKFFFMLMATILVMGTMNLGAFAMVQYSDMPNNWSTEALKHTIDNGIMEGYDGRIYPNRTLTRAEMAAMLNRVMGAMDMTDLSNYSDVPKEAWYYNDMAKSVQMGTLQGVDTLLNPTMNVTRAEVFVALMNTFKFEKGNAVVLEKFKDYKEIGNWALDASAAIVSAGYVGGFDGYLYPNKPITRAEFAQLIRSIANNYITTTPETASQYKGNVVIKTPDITLKDITIDGNLYIGDGVGDGNITLDNVVINGTIVLRGGGPNSLDLLGNTNAIGLYIARMANTIRVFSQTTIPMPYVNVIGLSNVILEGKFSNVNINSQVPSLTFPNTTISQLTLNSPIQKFNFSPSSTINSLIVNAQNTTISGQGIIKNAQINANNVSINVLGTVVKVAQNITGTMAGGLPISSGGTSTVAPPISTGSTSNTVIIEKATQVDARPTVDITVKLGGVAQSSFDLYFNDNLLASTTNGKITVATGVLSDASRLKVVINGTTYSGSALTIQ